MRLLVALVLLVISCGSLEYSDAGAGAGAELWNCGRAAAWPGPDAGEGFDAGWYWVYGPSCDTSSCAICWPCRLDCSGADGSACAECSGEPDPNQ